MTTNNMQVQERLAGSFYCAYEAISRYNIQHFIHKYLQCFTYSQVVVERPQRILHTAAGGNVERFARSCCLRFEPISSALSLPGTEIQFLNDVPSVN